MFEASFPSSSMRRSIATLLVAVVMVLRGLVPAGFMPAVSVAGTATLEFVICTGGRLEVRTGDADGEAERPVVPADHQQACAFAQLSSYFLVGAMSAAVPGPIRPSAVAGMPQNSARLSHRQVPGLGARAPPAVG